MPKVLIDLPTKGKHCGKCQGTFRGCAGKMKCTLLKLDSGGFTPLDDSEGEPKRCDACHAAEGAAKALACGFAEGDRVKTPSGHVGTIVTLVATLEIHENFDRPNMRASYLVHEPEVKP